eukprot:gene7397-10082_t
MLVQIIALLLIQNYFVFSKSIINIISIDSKFGRKSNSQLSHYNVESIRPSSLSPSINKIKLSKVSDLQIDLDAESQLPWQIKILLKLFVPLKVSIDPTESNAVAKYKQRQSLRLSTPSWVPLFSKHVAKFCSKYSQILLEWMSSHKESFIFIGKAMIAVYLGLAILKRIGHWYSGMAEYEILLDHTDYDYNSFGSHLNGVGIAVLSSLNQSTINELKYGSLYNRLAVSLDKPCFPQMMRDYSIHTGRDVAIFLSEIDNRIRAYKKKLINSQRNNLVYTQTPSMLMKKQEIMLLLSFQKVITILQVRQADAYLRLTRLQILSAANICEDLMIEWKNKLLKSTSALKQPFYRYILMNMIGFSVGVRTRTVKGLTTAVNMLKFGEYDTTINKHKKPRKKKIISNNEDNLALNERVNYNKINSTNLNNRPSSSNNYSYENTATQTIANTNTATNLRSSIDKESAEYLEKVLKGLNPHEKIVLIENMLKNFYELSGQIQKHLEDLSSISKSFSLLSDYSYNSYNGNNDYNDIEHNKMNDNNTIVESLSNRKEDGMWLILDQWIWKSSLLCASSISLVSLWKQNSINYDYNSPIVSSTMLSTAPSTSSDVNEQLRSNLTNLTSAPVETLADYHNITEIVSDHVDAINNTLKQQGDISESFSPKINMVNDYELLQPIENFVYKPNNHTYLYPTDAIALLCIYSNNYMINNIQINDNNYNFNIDNNYNNNNNNRFDRPSLNTMVIDEFYLDITASDVIEKCLIRNHVFLSALETTSTNIAKRSYWEPIDYTKNSPLIKHIINQNNLFNINHLHNIWSREIQFNQMKRNLFIGTSTITSTTVLQLLNLNKMYIESDTGEERGSALLSEFIALSASGYQTEGNYTVNWLLENLSPNDNINNGDNKENYDRNQNNYHHKKSSDLHHRVRVKVMLDINIPSSLYNHFVIKSNIIKDIKSSLLKWKTISSSLFHYSITTTSSPLVDETIITSNTQNNTYNFNNNNIIQNGHNNSPEILLPSSSSSSILSNKINLHFLELKLLDSIGKLNVFDDEYDSDNHDNYIKTNNNLMNDEKLYKVGSTEILYKNARNYIKSSFIKASSNNNNNNGFSRANIMFNTYDLDELYHQNISYNTHKNDINHNSNDDNIMNNNYYYNYNDYFHNPRSQEKALNIIRHNFKIHRSQWRNSAIVLRDLTKAPIAFSEYLELVGLRRRNRKGILGLLHIRTLMRLGFWTGILAAGFEFKKWSSDIVWGAEVIRGNILDFIERRVTSPTISILNDVILNKRVSLSDKEALKDAKRSLSTMIYDFLKERRPKLSDMERRSIVSNLDMRPISEDYEILLRNPIPNIISGRIARLVLIQLQFVKKELLVAMQAIDELFNANQVNLQLLAVTPAILSIISLQVISKTIIAMIKSTSRGRIVESISVIHRDLKNHLRELERILCVSVDYHNDLINRQNYIYISNNNSSSSVDEWVTNHDMGKIMSILHRMQTILTMNSASFELLALTQLQEDLRDLSIVQLSMKQRLLIIDRIIRSYPFMQPARRIWSGGFLQ